MSCTIFPSIQQLVLPVLICIGSFGGENLYAQSVSATYTAGDIPTNFNVFSPNCNGPSTKLSITLPSGSSVNVTGINISYQMTAQNPGLMSHQRSYVKCVNTSSSEDTIYSGIGATSGTYTYVRNNIDIANGPYGPNTVIQFEMRAWRTSSPGFCVTNTNKVDNGTWTITVHYQNMIDEGSTGIGTTSPATSAILDLQSTSQAFLPPRMTTQQRNAIAAPINGMMIFNTTTQKLEIFSSGWATMNFYSPPLTKIYGGSFDDIVRSIKQTADGGYIIAGYSNSSNIGTLTGLINNGLNDGWIIKMDNAQNITWQKLLGGSSNDFVYDVQQTSDGGYILAGSSLSSNSGTLTGVIGNGGSDYWVIKLNSNGNTVWQKLLGGTLTEDAFSIQQTTDGGYILNGYSTSSNTGNLTGLTNNGGEDYWIVKLDMDGNISWQKLLGGSSNDRGQWVVQKNGGYAIAGNSLSSNSGTLIGNFSNGAADAWILSLDSIGNIEWQKLLGGSANDGAKIILELPGGDFLIGGNAASSGSGTLAGSINNGAEDFWIMKITSMGILYWQKLFGGANLDELHTLQVVEDGSFVVGGVLILYLLIREH